MIPLNSGRYLVQSVPGEMSLDQVSVLDQAEKHRGLVTENILQKNLQWDQQRSELVLERMVGCGQLWVDSQGQGGHSDYWVPSLFCSSQ